MHFQGDKNISGFYIGRIKKNPGSSEQRGSMGVMGEDRGEEERKGGAWRKM